jgi:hypothetical protein
MLDFDLMMMMMMMSQKSLYSNSFSFEGGDFLFVLFGPHSGRLFV